MTIKVDQLGQGAKEVSVNIGGGLQYEYAFLPSTPVAYVPKDTSGTIVSPSVTGQGILEFIYVEDVAKATKLTSLEFPDLASAENGFSITSATTMDSLSLPLLDYVGGPGLIAASLTALTSLSAPSLKKVNAFELTGADALTSLTLPGLSQVVNDFTISSLPILTSVSLPSIVSLTSVSVGASPSLQNFTIGSTIKSIGAGGITISGAALTQSCVDDILAKLVSLDGTNGTTLFAAPRTVDLSLGTSAGPSAAGLANIVILEARGVVVTCNGTSIQAFSYTGAQQTFVVPTAITSIVVDAIGAGSGMNVWGDPGSPGGRVQAAIAVTPGETLYVNVGGVGGPGGTDAGGWNGGGAAATSWRAAGGGASDIRQGGTALADRILVAAGAGGPAPNLIAGGVGGGLVGGSDGTGLSTGGTQSAGGVSGADAGVNGALGQGGSGSVSGVGGGGGYYGGAGGGYKASISGNVSGSGGSSLVPAGGTTTSGYGPLYANGSIIFTW